MSEAEQSPQEGRTETFAIRLTPTEKRAVRWVADLRNLSESDLVRSYGLDDVISKIVGRYEEARAAAGAWAGNADSDAAA